MKRLMIALLAICSFGAATFAQKQEKKKPAEQTAPAKKEKAAADTSKHAAHKAHAKKAASEKKS
jgi:Ni/Co efflux regulator RcnB